MKKAISILLLTVICVCSLISCNVEKEPTTEYIKYKGELIDISTLPREMPYTLVEYEIEKPEEYIENITTFLKKPSIAGVIMKITVSGYAESITEKNDNLSLVDCVVEKVFYQNERNPIQLQKGKQVKCQVNYNVDSGLDGEPVFMAHDIITILRKDHSYIIFGAMTDEGIVGHMSFCGAFEISSDSYERAFYEFVGITRYYQDYYYDVKARVLKYYK